MTLCLTLLLLFTVTTYAKSSNPLVGCWCFVKAVSSDGVVDNTWGSHPVGYLIYTPENMMSAQIMRKKRADKETNIDANFFAYSGHYEIDEKNHVVTHHVETALFADMVGKDYQRFYRFEGDYLYLAIAESKKGKTFIWKKCT